jgi:hypothetical protein
MALDLFTNVVGGLARKGWEALAGDQDAAEAEQRRQEEERRRLEEQRRIDEARQAFEEEQRRQQEASARIEARQAQARQWFQDAVGSMAQGAGQVASTVGETVGRPGEPWGLSDLGTAAQGVAQRAGEAAAPAVAQAQQGLATFGQATPEQLEEARRRQEEQRRQAEEAERANREAWERAAQGPVGQAVGAVVRPVQEAAEDVGARLAARGPVLQAELERDVPRLAHRVGEGLELGTRLYTEAKSERQRAAEAEERAHALQATSAAPIGPPGPAGEPPPMTEPFHAPEPGLGAHAGRGVPGGPVGPVGPVGPGAVRTPWDELADWAQEQTQRGVDLVRGLPGYALPQTGRGTILEEWLLDELPRLAAQVVRAEEGVVVSGRNLTGGGPAMRVLGRALSPSQNVVALQQGEPPLTVGEVGMAGWDTLQDTFNVLSAAHHPFKKVGLELLHKALHDTGMDPLLAGAISMAAHIAWLDEGSVQRSVNLARRQGAVSNEEAAKIAEWHDEARRIAEAVRTGAPGPGGQGMGEAYRLLDNAEKLRRAGEATLGGRAFGAVVGGAMGVLRGMTEDPAAPMEEKLRKAALYAMDYIPHGSSYFSGLGRSFLSRTGRSATGAPGLPGGAGAGGTAPLPPAGPGRPGRGLAEAGAGIGSAIGATAAAASGLGETLAREATTPGTGLEYLTRPVRPIGEGWALSAGDVGAGLGGIGRGVQRAQRGDVPGGLLEAGAGALGTVGGVFGVPGRMVEAQERERQRLIREAGITDAPAVRPELLGAAAQFVTPFGGASTLGRMATQFGPVRRAVTGGAGALGGVTGAVVGGREAIEQGMAPGTAAQHVATRALQGADVGLGVTELGGDIARGLLRLLNRPGAAAPTAPGVTAPGAPGAPGVAEGLRGAAGNVADVTRGAAPELAERLDALRAQWGDVRAAEAVVDAMRDALLASGRTPEQAEAQLTRILRAQGVDPATVVPPRPAPGVDGAAVPSVPQRAPDPDAIERLLRYAVSPDGARRDLQAVGRAVGPETAGAVVGGAAGFAQETDDPWERFRNTLGGALAGGLTVRAGRRLAGGPGEVPGRVRVAPRLEGPPGAPGGPGASLREPQPGQPALPGPPREFDLTTRGPAPELTGPAWREIEAPAPGRLALGGEKVAAPAVHRSVAAIERELMRTEAGAQLEPGGAPTRDRIADLRAELAQARDRERALQRVSGRPGPEEPTPEAGPGPLEGLEIDDLRARWQALPEGPEREAAGAALDAALGRLEARRGAGGVRGLTEPEPGAAARPTWTKVASSNLLEREMEADAEFPTMGWITPDGRLASTESTNHDTAAYDALAAAGQRPRNWDAAYKTLRANGYTRLWYQEDDLIGVDSAGPPTPEGLRLVKEIRARHPTERFIWELHEPQSERLVASGEDYEGWLRAVEQPSGRVGAALEPEPGAPPTLTPTERALGTTAFGQPGGQPPTAGERFRERQGIAQPTLGFDPRTPEAQVVSALDQRAAEAEAQGITLERITSDPTASRADVDAYYPTPQELAQLPGAPPATHRFGGARPYAELLDFVNEGLARGAHHWYGQAAEMLRTYARPLEAALGDPSERQDLWQELVALYGRTGERTTPENNLEIALGAILARDDLTRQGVDVATLDPTSQDDIARLRYAMRPYMGLVTGPTRGEVDVAALKAEVARRKTELARLYPDGRSPAVEQLTHTPARKKADAAALPRASVPTMGDVLGELLRLWGTGRADVAGNLKLASYFTVLKDEATGQVSLVTVPDIWIYTAYGYERPDVDMQNPVKSRHIMGSLARLAGERGLVPGQLQAALWVGARAKMETDPRLRAEVDARYAAAERPRRIEEETGRAVRAEEAVRTRLPAAEGAQAALRAAEAAYPEGAPAKGPTAAQRARDPEAAARWDALAAARRGVRGTRGAAERAEAEASEALGRLEEARTGPIVRRPSPALFVVRQRWADNGYGAEVGDLSTPEGLADFMARTGTPESMERANEGLIALVRDRAGTLAPAPRGGELEVTHRSRYMGLPYEQSGATAGAGRERALTLGRTVRFAPPWHPGSGTLAAEGLEPPPGWGDDPARAPGLTRQYLTDVWGYDDNTQTLKRLEPYVRHRVTLDLVGTWADDAGSPVEEYNVALHLPGATEAQTRQVAALVGAATLQDGMGTVRLHVDVPADLPTLARRVLEPGGEIDNRAVLAHPEGRPWTREEIGRVFGAVVPGMETTPGGHLVINNYEGAPTFDFVADVVARLEQAAPGYPVADLLRFESAHFDLIERDQYGQLIRQAGDPTSGRLPGEPGGAPAGDVAGAVRGLGPRAPGAPGPAVAGAGLLADLWRDTRGYLEAQGWRVPATWEQRAAGALGLEPGLVGPAEPAPLALRAGATLEYPEPARAAGPPGAARALPEPQGVTRVWAQPERPASGTEGPAGLVDVSQLPFGLGARPQGRQPAVSAAELQRVQDALAREAGTLTPGEVTDSPQALGGWLTRDGRLVPVAGAGGTGLGGDHADAIQAASGGAGGKLYGLHTLGLVRWQTVGDKLMVETGLVDPTPQQLGMLRALGRQMVGGAIVEGPRDAEALGLRPASWLEPDEQSLADAFRAPAPGEASDAEGGAPWRGLAPLPVPGTGEFDRWATGIIQDAPPIPGTEATLVNAARYPQVAVQTVQDGQLHPAGRAAGAEAKAALVRALGEQFERQRQTLEQHLGASLFGPREVRFGGLILGRGYLAINVSGVPEAPEAGVAPGGLAGGLEALLAPNRVYVNLHRSAVAARDEAAALAARMGARQPGDLLLRELELRALASHLSASLVHELTHQQQGAHGAAFDALQAANREQAMGAILDGEETLEALLSERDYGLLRQLVAEAAYLERFDRGAPAGQDLFAAEYARTQPEPALAGRGRGPPAGGLGLRARPAGEPAARAGGSAPLAPRLPGRGRGPAGLVPARDAGPAPELAPGPALGGRRPVGVLAEPEPAPEPAPAPGPTRGPFELARQPARQPVDDEAARAALEEDGGTEALERMRPGAARQFLDLTKLGMLLSVRGLERQLIQNAAQVGYQVPERAVAGALALPQRALRAARGRPTTDLPRPEEAATMLVAQLRALPGATLQAGRYVAGRASRAEAEGQAVKEAQRGPLGPGHQEGLVDAGYRVFGFFDTIGRQMAREAELAAQRSRGVPEEAAQRAAAGAGAYRTVQQELGRGEGEPAPMAWVEEFTRAIKGVSDTTLGQVVIPFLRIMYNGVKYDLERSPAGLLKTTTVDTARQAWAGARGKPLPIPPTEYYERWARGLLGTGLGLALIVAAGEDNVTGPEPTDPTELAAWRAENKRPFAMRIAGRWVPMGLVPGLNATLVQVVSARDYLKRLDERGQQLDPEHWYRLVNRVVTSTAKNLYARPFFESLYRDLEQVFRADEEGGAGLGEVAADVARSRLVPGSALLREIERVGSDVERAPRDPAEAIMAGVPGLSGMVPPRRDVYGREVRRPGGPGIEGALERLFTPESAGLARESIRRYRGTADAIQDTAVRDALKRVQDYEAARKAGTLGRLGPEDVPTAREVALARLMAEREEPNWKKWRGQERGRLAEERARRAWSLPGRGAGGGLAAQGRARQGGRGGGASRAARLVGVGR